MSRLNLCQDITIGTLREHHPSWAWTAERHGMWWQYRGTKDDQRVRVYACSVIVDEFETCKTVWYVDDGRRADTYWYWSIPSAEEALGIEVQP